MKNQSSTRLISLTLAAASWLGQQAWAQAAPQNPGQQPPATAGSAQAGASNPAQPEAVAQAQAAPQKTDPADQGSAGANNKSGDGRNSEPLQPVTTYPDASGAEHKTQSAETKSLPAAPQPKPQAEEPQGAATAEKVSTTGGAAAKPAGVAIAPAKQHRTRSILIKVGALAAAGVAAGTVYALSRGTPSVPPGSNSPVAVPK